MNSIFIVLAFACVASAEFFVGGKNDIYSWDDVNTLCQSQGARIAEPSSQTELDKISLLARRANAYSIVFTGITMKNDKLSYSDGSLYSMAPLCQAKCFSPAYWSYGQSNVNTVRDFQLVNADNQIFSLVTPICEV